MKKNIVVAVIILLVVGYLSQSYWQALLFSSSNPYRANQLIWSDDGVDHKDKRAWIEKVELINESCDKISFRVSYFNTGKTDGYIRFNTSSKPDPEGSRGDHSITLRQGRGSDVFQEWIIAESPGGETNMLWVSLEEIVDKKFHDIVDRVKLPFNKTWQHGCE